MGPARLTIQLFGGELVANIAEETLSHKGAVRWDEARVRALSKQIVVALARANRGHKLTEANLADLRTAGEELYRLLIPEALRADLAAFDARPLLIEMDEALVPIPWELLFDGKDFFCRRYDLGRAVFTQRPRKAQGPRKVGRPARMLVLCSDPSGDLPAVDAEAEAIVDALEGTPGLAVRMASGKGIEFVQKQIKDFDLVHYAGHAHFDPAAPEQSGWRLTDGTLTAGQVAELAGGRPMPFLVFANACQSSHEEDPTRVFGLANAFLMSGVRYYLGTQWEVVDAMSQTFAESFWSELARGRSVGTAVRKARSAVIVSEGEGGLGWASYVLYGDPSFVLLEPEDTEPAKVLPTPAEIAQRESIRAAAKKARPASSSGSSPRAQRASIPPPVRTAKTPQTKSGTTGLWAVAIVLAGIALAMFGWVVLHH